MKKLLALLLFSVVFMILKAEDEKKWKIENEIFLQQKITNRNMGNCGFSPQEIQLGYKFSYDYKISKMNKFKLELLPTFNITRRKGDFDGYDAYWLITSKSIISF